LLPDRLSFFLRRVIKITHIDDTIIKSHDRELQNIIGHTKAAVKSLSKNLAGSESEPDNIGNIRNRVIDQSVILQNIQGEISTVRTTNINQEVMNGQ